MRRVLTFRIPPPWLAARAPQPPSSRRTRTALALLVGGVLLPGPARAEAAARSVVGEAIFLCDPLPPGGNEVALSLAVEPGSRPDGAASFVPRAQLALRPGARVGVTADVGYRLGADAALASPTAALKLILRDPAGGALGVLGSLDAAASTHAPGDSEAGLSLGLIRALGPLTLRAGARFSTPVGEWGPRLHAGASAATELGARTRLLGELVVESGGGLTTFAAGPTVKVALDERTSLAGAALLGLSARPASIFVVQVTRGL